MWMVGEGAVAREDDKVSASALSMPGGGIVGGTGGHTCLSAHCVVHACTRW